MTSDELRRCCLGKPGVVEDFPFGERVSVFKVKGKMFALSDLDERPLEVSLKCDPDLAEALRSQQPAIRAGYHLNKRHWNTVTIDGSIDDNEIEVMIQDSYDLVVAKLTRVNARTLALEETALSFPVRSLTRRSGPIAGPISTGRSGTPSGRRVVEQIAESACRHAPTRASRARGSWLATTGHLATDHFTPRQGSMG